MFQRTASLISSMQHLYTQTDKHLCPYCSTGGWPRGAGWGVGSGPSASLGTNEWPLEARGKRLASKENTVAAQALRKSLTLSSSFAENRAACPPPYLRNGAEPGGVVVAGL